MLDQSKSELQQTTEQLSEKFESIDDEGNLLLYTVLFILLVGTAVKTCQNIH